eukprot:TRINITY_DN390_c0_g2_i1.p1 TRINITY_DN390_c0_g2~~TRINITY_DN390_c0_g2_i1.p1  ORF type:complete len:1495 (+),score=618.52 TRINITY_DN390_c0_g2_i1:77-4561(+)
MEKTDLETFFEPKETRYDFKPIRFPGRLNKPANAFKVVLYNGKVNIHKSKEIKQRRMPERASDFEVEAMRQSMELESIIEQQAQREISDCEKLCATLLSTCQNSVDLIRAIFTSIEKQTESNSQCAVADRDFQEAFAQLKSLPHQKYALRHYFLNVFRVSFYPLLNHSLGDAFARFIRIFEIKHNGFAGDFTEEIRTDLSDTRVAIGQYMLWKYPCLNTIGIQEYLDEFLQFVLIASLMPEIERPFHVMYANKMKEFMESCQKEPPLKPADFGVSEEFWEVCLHPSPCSAVGIATSLLLQLGIGDLETRVQHCEEALHAIMDVLQEAGQKMAGADDMFPVAAYIMYRAHPNHIYGQLKFLESLVPDSLAQSKFGYSLATLQTAIESVINTRKEVDFKQSLPSCIVEENESENQEIVKVQEQDDEQQNEEDEEIYEQQNEGDDDKNIIQAEIVTDNGEEHHSALTIPIVANLVDDDDPFPEIQTSIIPDDLPDTPKTGTPLVLNEIDEIPIIPTIEDHEVMIIPTATLIDDDSLNLHVDVDDEQQGVIPTASIITIEGGVDVVNENAMDVPVVATFADEVEAMVVSPDDEITVSAVELIGQDQVANTSNNDTLPNTTEVISEVIPVVPSTLEVNPEYVAIAVPVIADTCSTSNIPIIEDNEVMVTPITEEVEDISGSVDGIVGEDNVLAIDSDNIISEACIDETDAVVVAKDDIIEPCVDATVVMDTVDTVTEPSCIVEEIIESDIVVNEEHSVIAIIDESTTNNNNNNNELIIEQSDSVAVINNEEEEESNTEFSNFQIVDESDLYDVNISQPDQSCTNNEEETIQPNIVATTDETETELNVVNDDDDDDNNQQREQEDAIKDINVVSEPSPIVEPISESPIHEQQQEEEQSNKQSPVAVVVEPANEVEDEQTIEQYPATGSIEPMGEVIHESDKQQQQQETVEISEKINTKNETKETVVDLQTVEIMSSMAENVKESEDIVDDDQGNSDELTMDADEEAALLAELMEFEIKDGDDDDDKEKEEIVVIAENKIEEDEEKSPLVSKEIVEVVETTTQKIEVNDINKQVITTKGKDNVIDKINTPIEDSNSNTPTSSIDTPTSSIDTPTSRIDTPTSSINTPTASSQVATSRKTRLPPLRPAHRRRNNPSQFRRPLARGMSSKAKDKNSPLGGLGAMPDFSRAPSTRGMNFDFVVNDSMSMLPSSSSLLDEIMANVAKQQQEEEVENKKREKQLKKLEKIAKKNEKKAKKRSKNPPAVDTFEINNSNNSIPPMTTSINDSSSTNSPIISNNNNSNINSNNVIPMVQNAIQPVAVPFFNNGNVGSSPSSTAAPIMNNTQTQQQPLMGISQASSNTTTTVPSATVPASSPSVFEVSSSSISSQQLPLVEQVVLPVSSDSPQPTTGNVDSPIVHVRSDPSPPIRAPSDNSIDSSFYLPTSHFLSNSDENDDPAEDPAAESEDSDADEGNAGNLVPTNATNASRTRSRLNSGDISFFGDM